MADLNLKRTFMGSLGPDKNQTDIPHMVYLAKHCLLFNDIRSDYDFGRGDADKVALPDFCKIEIFKEITECKTEHYYGGLSDSFVSRELPSKNISDRMFEGAIDLARPQEPFIPEVYIESLILCPKPNLLSTGSHRVVVVFWMFDERFGMAFEEGGDILNPLDENIFIDGLTPGADEILKDLWFDQNILIPAIVYGMTDYELYPPAHKFSIKIFNSTILEQDPTHTGHWFEGCRPS